MEVEGGLKALLEKDLTGSKTTYGKRRGILEDSALKTQGEAEGRAK